ncbi:linear amide C-N hydrolase [Peredibacter starrii]|uniref:Linear amide C-N hydrolase n=1 Tax=Peredibacter starrii TaxID=28202 RepID=A0AAX4HP10_9BACT|nr:linear amide C-N hydrolase [Peredibacter starrii]WPU65046.1 linear amide C-N hydrolase [Peredibacter starrii]
MKMFTLSLFAFTLSLQSSLACTRAVYFGANKDIITARTMDWKADIQTNLWIFPQGMKRNGVAGPNSVEWTSKYGSVIASGYEVGTTDGMNEKGLVANILWLVESEYPKFEKSRPAMAVSIWGQYVLDNFSTVKEAVKALKSEPFIVVTDNVPGENRLATVHLSLSDASGDSAIFEYVKGKLVIHHDRKYQVMTNSPIFEKQLALEEYWKEIGGTTMLPGTNRSADRFARASFYINSIPKSKDPVVALASVFSVIRNVSVPYGITTPDQPNISSTRWRSVADHSRLMYFFESALTPNTFWVNLKEVDFSSKTGKVMKLDLGKDQRNVYSGNAVKDFKISEPFKFLGL